MAVARDSTFSLQWNRTKSLIAEGKTLQEMLDTLDIFQQLSQAEVVEYSKEGEVLNVEWADVWYTDNL